jgi:adenosylcobinamide kinase / adenosylcobinamide-phosphate guanylyltransferase
MITVVLGGARSGKSVVAERLATGGAVTYLATGVATDPGMAARIEGHRQRRPASWATVEVNDDGDLAEALRSTVGMALVDGLGTWLARRPDFAADAGALCAALVGRDGDTVVVSDEVGLGVHPSTEVGRSFRDALGLLNQAVAEVADDVLLVVAGRVLSLGRVP